MAFETTIRLLKQASSPEQFVKLHARYAKKVLAAHLATLPEKPEVDRYVDGRKGAPEESVKFGGVIRYEFLRLGSVAHMALDLARQLSPVGPGRTSKDKTKAHYRDAWFLMVDGKEVDRVPPGAREIILTNDMPYHRKLEMTVNSDGIMGKGTFSRPAGIVEKVRQQLFRRFGENSFDAQITFMDLQNAYVLKGRGRQLTYLKDIPKRGIRAGMPRPMKKDRAAGVTMTYPALIIRPF